MDEYREENFEVSEINNTPADEDENPNYLKFKVPYTFEDKTYYGLDLTGLENVTTDQIYAIQKQLAKDGVVSSTPELEMEYCCLFMAAACDLPYAFFNKLPAKDGVQIRAQVTNFLFGAD